MIKNNRGSLTIDYLFAFCLVSAFSLVIVTFSASLTMVEVVQYTAFASARKFFAGNVDLPSQQASGAKKLNSLLSSPTVAPLLNGGYFSINQKGIYIGPNVPTAYPSFKNYDDPRGNLFHGVVIPFTTNILNFTTGFFGSTQTTGGGAFTVNINSFLGREPSFQECASFWSARWQAIQNLKNKQGAKGYTSDTEGDPAQVIDNGC